MIARSLAAQTRGRGRERPRAVALALLSSALLAVFTHRAVAQDDIRLREQDGIAWACGGIGYGERSALRALEARSNLVLLFVSGSRGAFVADVGVRITHSAQADVGLEIVSEGPMCVVRLPTGTWQVQARWRDETRQQTVQVPSAAGSPRRVTLSFSEDKTPSPAASSEEKSGVGDSGRVNTGR